MRNREIGELNPPSPCTVGVNDTVLEAVRRMVDLGLCMVAAVDGPKLRGTLTTRAVLRKVVLDGKDPASVKVREIMTPNPPTADLHEDSHEVLDKMERSGACYMPVLDAGRVAATASARMLLRHEVAGKEQDIRDIEQRWEYLPPERGFGG